VTAPAAIVDVGSNSVRLLLFGGLDADGPTGPRVTTVTALRRGAGPDGDLAEDALARLDACLEDYARRMAAARVRSGMALGTSAVRDAPNRMRVAQLVRRRLGLPLTVLTGAQEAGLAFAGARVAVPGDGPITVLDVGGASTELVRAAAGTAPAAVSLQLGGVRTTEAHLHSDPPAAAELAAVRAEARREVLRALEEIGRAGGAEPLIGVAGTVTTLAAVDAGRYDPRVVHGRVLTRDTVAALFARLAALPLERRRRVPGLEPARAPVIVTGAAIVLEVMHAAAAPDLTVSERDLLDGAALAADRLAAPVDRGEPPVLLQADLAGPVHDG